MITESFRKPNEPRKIVTRIEFPVSRPPSEVRSGDDIYIFSQGLERLVFSNLMYPKSPVITTFDDRHLTMEPRTCLANLR